MSIRTHRSVFGALTGGSLMLLFTLIVWLTQLVYPSVPPHRLDKVAGGERRVELQQAQAQVQNGFRSQLLQALGGVVLMAGAVAGWQQLRLAREGQIAERFTRAFDHLGSYTLDVRLGGIYALERVAKNSPTDQPTVTDILCAFVREHSPWRVGAPDGPQHPTPVVDSELPWLTTRAPDVQTALYVLGRRSGHPQEHTMYLSRADLRRAQLSKAWLERTNLRHTNLARAYMPESNLEHGQLVNTDLRHAHLRKARLSHADMRNARLDGADLRQATLRGADLRGANLSGARLDEADLTDVRTDDATIWPDAHRPA